MKNLSKSAILLASAALLASCAHSPGARRDAAGPEPLVTAGVADNNPKNIAAGRAAAVQDAQLEALRRVIRLYAEVSDRGPTETDPQAYGGPQQYVARYKIVSEGAEGAYYKVSVRSWVQHARLAAAMRGSGPAAGSGARAVLLAADPQGTGFSKAFRLALARRGAVSAEELAGLKPEESDGAAAAAAAASGAELLLRVSVSAAASGAGLNTGFFPATADAALKVLEADSGKTLLEISRQGSAIDSSQAASFGKAAASAAELLAQEVSAKADKLTKREQAVLIKVAGLRSFEEVERLKADLSKVDLKRLRLETYAEGLAVFSAVPKRPDPQELASAVLRGDSFGLELEGTSPQEIRFFAAR